jgi:hypothetical protein
MTIMKYSSRFMLSVLLVSTIPASVGLRAAPQAQATPLVEQPVARVLNDNISRRQIELDTQERRDAKRKYKGAEYEKYVSDYQAEQLASLILGPLLKEYATAHTIRASVDEINSMSRAVFGKRIARGANKTLAEAAVIQWKVSKVLYQQYGGTVIFQQSNPFEPVGAYGKFLAEQEQKKAFEIFDPQHRQAFWCYFTCEQSMIVPPEKVNYDVPWWLQKEK